KNVWDCHNVHGGGGCNRLGRCDFVVFGSGRGGGEVAGVLAGNRLTGCTVSVFKTYRAITINLDQTSRYSANYNDMTAIRIGVIDMDCEEYSQEVLGFSDVIASGNPTPYYDPIVSTYSLTLIPFGDSDFLLEEVDAFLAFKDDPTSPKEKSHFMVKEGIVLGHKISKDGFEVDKAKVDVIAKLHHPATVKEFKFKVIDTKGAENLAADHLSRLENPHQNVLDPKEIHKSFPLETLNMVSFRGNSSTSWERFCNEMKCLKIPSKFARFLTFGACFHRAVLVFMKEQVYTRSCRLLVEMGRSESAPTNDAQVVWKFLKSLFTRFGTPRAIISDRGTHFYNEQFTKVMLKYGVTHRLATVYHPQTNGQVEVSNPFKTPIGCTPYKLVYGKACHQPIELKHKAYWALKHVNFDLQTVGDHRKVQPNELNKLRDQAYENSLIYKEKTKRPHDSKIKDRIFNVDVSVPLFNFRLKIFSRKLKTRWSGPFTITHVFPYGTVELSQTDGPNFRVNGHRLKHYFGEDIPKMVIPDLQTFPKD
nr:reverse transcriptase domain-containing protein [Tanacetum cinerariifolium]